MPDIEIEKESKFKKLKPHERDDLAQTIGDWYANFQDKRTSQIDTAEKIKEQIYLNQPNRNANQAWKSNIKENRLYTTKDSLKATMWRDIWSKEEQMFDVVGKSTEDDKTAKLQKQAIVHALKEMQAGVQFDKATENWFIFGDFIYKTDWKQRKKLVKRPDVLKPFKYVELPLYDNANIEAVDPLNFVWDITTLDIDNPESWDKCIKIHKRFESLEAIKNNQLYKLTQEQYDDLKSQDDTTSPTEAQTDKELAQATSYGDLKEVLYLHGDFRYNGVEYKNVIAEVIERKYLIYFEENPIFINPFVWGACEIDPETKRGISPLKCILDLTLGKEELVNKLGDAAELILNPPRIGDENSINEKYRNTNIEMEPGKIIGVQALGGQPLEQFIVNPQGIQEIAGYLDNVISDVSGVNANLMGSINAGDRKATELNLAQSGATSRIALKLDKIYQVNMKVIENVAELLAMFKTNSELIMIKDNGIKQEIEITQAIRQANYTYYYEDRNSLIDRRGKVQEALAMLTQAGQNPELMPRIDWEEALKFGLEAIGFENVDKFFKDNTPLDNLYMQLKQTPPQMQELFVQQAQPIIQQTQMIMQQQQAMQQQAGQMPQEQAIQGGM